MKYYCEQCGEEIKETIEIDGIPIQDYGTVNSRTVYPAEIQIGETIKSNIDYWRNLYFEEKEKNIKLQKRNDRHVKIINKRDKNIEELKEIAKKDWEERCRLTFELEDYISKDKIREKLKEYDGLKIIDKSAYEEQVKPLKELLEEE